MSNDSSDPRSSKNLNSVAGSVFGIDLKKKHELDFLDDFDSGFDLSAITGIPNKVEPKAQIAASKDIATKGDSQPTKLQEILSEASDVRLGQSEAEAAGVIEDDTELAFSWDEAEESQSDALQDDFGFGLVEPQQPKPVKKKKPVPQQKKPVTSDKKSASPVASASKESPAEEKKVVEVANNAPADWDADHQKPATTQAKDDFWDPLEDWSWDDNTHQPLKNSPVKSAAEKSPVEKNPADKKHPQKNHAERRESHKEPAAKHPTPAPTMGAKSDKKFKGKGDKQKTEVSAHEPRDQKHRSPKTDRPHSKPKDLIEDDISLKEHQLDTRGTSFDDDEPISYHKTGGKTLNLNDLLEDWDHNSTSSHDDLDLDDEQMEVETDDYDDDDNDFKSKKPSRSQPAKSSSAKKPARRYEDEDHEEVVEAFEDDFTDDDFDDAEFSFEEEDEDAPVSPPRRKPEERNPPRQRSERTAEKSGKSREPNKSREEREVPAKPAKKSAAQLNIPTWEEAISIVLEANAHLMTQPSKSGGRSSSAYYGSSGGENRDGRGGKKRGKRPPQRRKNH